MAVIQISKIQVRRGLQENLPNLDSGEFGWAIDTQRLFIGKGSIAEGAPASGVTEILTTYSVAGLNSILANVAGLAANVTILQSNVATLQSNVYPATITLADNQSSANTLPISINGINATTIDYNLIRTNTSRVGTIKVAAYNGNVIYEDDYSETANTGIMFNFVGNGANVVMQYTSSSIGNAAVFTYYIKQFTHP